MVLAHGGDDDGELVARTAAAGASSSGASRAPYVSAVLLRVHQDHRGRVVHDRSGGQPRHRLRTLLWTICLCLAFFGVKGGVLGVLSGGGTTILRGPGGMLEDNNDFALAMVMNIPLMFYLSKRTEDLQILIRQLAIYRDSAATMVTVLLTHSRGAFLSATATSDDHGLALGEAVPGDRECWAFLTVLFFALRARARRSNASRASARVAKESSAGARLRAWKIAAFSHDRDQNPVLGVGLRHFQLPLQEERRRLAHLEDEKHVVRGAQLLSADLGGERFGRRS